MKHNFINKKTGAEARVIAMYLDSDGVMQVDGYNTVEDLMDDYVAHEDHKPADPLIGNKKIRKAVRAWAEANEISQAQFDRYTSGFSASDDGHNFLSMISFDGFVFNCVDGEYYTIAELCGEL